MKLSTLIKAAGRELGMRRNVYPRRVADRKMRMETAAEEIAAMEKIHAILKALESSPAARRELGLQELGIEPESEPQPQPQPEQRNLL